MCVNLYLNKIFPIHLSQLNTDFLQEPFLVGDVRVGDERHMMFATDEQLGLLQRAKRLYLDATFRVVSRPFYQLFSIHAFLKQEEAMKQVPLMYILMSKRRKQDYIAVS